MASLTATPDQTYGLVRITLDGTVLLDTANRSVVSGWGTPDVGPAYTYAGGTSSNDWLVTGNQLRHNQHSYNTECVSIIETNSTFSAITTQVGWGGVGTPSAEEDARVMSRYTDINNTYYAQLALRTDGNAYIEIWKRVGGSNTLLSGSSLVAGNVAGNVFQVNFLTQQHPLIANWVLMTATAWNITQGTAPITVSIADGSITSGTKIALASFITAGGPTLPRVISFTAVADPYDGSVSLYRVTPDGASTLVRNCPVITSDRQAVFLDDEAPLNTVVSYTLTTYVATLTSASVSITGAGGEIGWVKDPVVPANDVPLSFSLRPMADCTNTTGIGFTDMGDQTYADADGEFPLINASRPAVTQLTRKAGTENLTFVTLSLADAVTFENIMASGRILLIQLPTTYGWAYSRYGSDYVHVGQLTKARLQTQNYKHPQRVWTVPVSPTYAPPNVLSSPTGSNGVGGGRSTYAVMKASGLTNAQLKAANVTYAQLAQAQGY